MKQPTTTKWTLTTKLTVLGIFVSLIGTVVSIVFSLRADNVSQRALDVSQRAEDRASGKIRAKFDDLGVFNTGQKVLPSGVRKTRYESIDIFTVDDTQNLIEWGPTLRIKNTGDYPIDSIRVEVAYSVGGMKGEAVKQIWPIPVLGTSISVLEPPPFGKLDAGGSALLPIMKPLLQQMLKATLSKEYKDKVHYGTFQIRTFCRIVGATAYDRSERPGTPSLNLVWVPSHFPDDKNKLILEDLPRVMIEKE